MSSLFQGLVQADGRVKTTKDAPDGNAIAFRGLILREDGAVYVSTTGTITGHVGAVPIIANGAVRIVDITSSPDDVLPGALRVVTGRLYTDPTNLPQVIHQGVGLRADGRLCIVDLPGLGPELLPSTTFDDWQGFSTQNNGAAPAGWGKTGTHNATNYASGVTPPNGLRILSDGAFTGVDRPLTPNKTYRIEYEYSDKTASLINVRLGGREVGLTAVVGVRTVLEETALTETAFVVKRNSVACDCTLSFLSIRQVGA